MCKVGIHVLPSRQIQFGSRSSLPRVYLTILVDYETTLPRKGKVPIKRMKESASAW